MTTLLLAGAVDVAGAVDARASTAASPRAAVSTPRFGRNGHPMGIVPRVDASAMVSSPVRAAGTNPYCGGCAPPLLFNQGRYTDSPVGGGLTGVAGHVTIVPVYWAPSGYRYTPNYESIINAYIANVAAASNHTTNVFAAATQYYQTLSSVTTHIQYVITPGTPIPLSDPFPANYTSDSAGCQPDSGYTACVDDAALQAELQTSLTALSKPQNDAYIYMVMFPYNTSTGNPVMTCIYNGTSSATPTPNVTQACSSNSYCAYHGGIGFTSGDSGILYANEPFPRIVSGQSGCNSPDEGIQSPNGDSHADIVLSSFSHEASETITDWARSWYDSAGNENGDECAYTYGLSGGSTGATGDFLAAGTNYNQVINGGHYFTQTEFSNQDYALNRGDVVADNNSTEVYGCIQEARPQVNPSGANPPPSRTGPTSSIPNPVGGRGTTPGDPIFQAAGTSAQPVSSTGTVTSRTSATKASIGEATVIASPTAAGPTTATPGRSAITTQRHSAATVRAPQRSRSAAALTLIVDAIRRLVQFL